MICVTGCNGFVGLYLCRFLKERGERVVGIDVGETALSEVEYYKKVNIANVDEAFMALSAFDVSEIIHLAAIASPRMAKENPQLAVETNIIGSLSMFEYCRRNKNTRLLVIGSAEQYKKKESILFEQDPVEANSIYGATKIATEILGRQYVRDYSSNIVFTRSFNHSGPGQDVHYALPSFAFQFGEIALGRKEPKVETGNLESVRDFLDVRDVVSAYYSLLHKGEPGEIYNVCSGTGYSMRNLAEIIKGFTENREIAITESKDLIRSKEIDQIVGSNDKLKNLTGWSPRIPIKRMLRDIYDDTIEKLSEK